MANESLVLEHENYNENTRRWSLGLLNLRNTKLVRLEEEGKYIDPSLYKTIGHYLEFVPGFEYKADQIYTAVLEFNIKKSKFELNSAIAVALLGLLGTFLTVAYPDIRCIFTKCSAEDNELVFFSGPNWGYDEEKKQFFYTLGHRDVSNSGSFLPESNLKDKQFWVGFRLRDGVDPNEHHFEDGAAGPYTYRAGQDIAINVNKNLCLEAVTTGRYLQAVFVMTDPGLELENAFTVKNMGENVRIVKAPSVSIPTEDQC